MAAVAAVVVVASCSAQQPGADPAPPGPATSGPSSASSTPTPTPPPTATPASRPSARSCYRLDYDQAVAPTNDARPGICAGDHTAQTFAVDDLATVVGGHLLAVDSQQVQDQVARECPRRLPGFLGGRLQDVRLSMLRSVWFTPTVAESDAGADWYRCDVVAVTADDSLVQLSGRLRGVLASPQGRDDYGMCGTAEPGTAAFTRVVCRSDHSWRAISTVDLPSGDYPGVGVVREAGQGPCQDAGRAVAADALDFRWGYEWPTREQWRAGETYGLCWAPG